MSLTDSIASLATRIAVEIKDLRDDLVGHTHPATPNEIHRGTTPPSDTSLLWLDTS